MTGALMGFPVVSAAVSGANAGWWIDGHFGSAFQIAGGVHGQPGGDLGGVRKWDIWPNGNELLANNIAALATDTIFEPQCLTYNSQILAVNSSASNNTRINYFSIATLVPAGSFGVNHSGGASSQYDIKCPANMCAIQGPRGQDYIITTGVVERQTVNCIYVQGKGNHVLGNIDEHAAVIGSCPDGSGLVAYVLGYPDTTGGASAGACGLYAVNDGLFSKVGTILPSAVDPAWTGWTWFYGIAIDQTDGNPIIGVATSQNHSPCGYIVKLNKATAAVMWAVPVGTTVAAGVPLSFDSQDMRQSTIKNGKFYYLGGVPESFYTIDTVAGTGVLTAINNATVDPLHPQQISEDVTNSIFWWGAWAEATTHPTYIGAYCGTGGNHSGSAMGWRYWPSGVPGTPGPGGALLPVPVYAIADAGRKRAWNMDLDGHSFYVLDLGSEGTFAYDDTTSTWSKFITFGYNQWDLVNGCMWDQRIVGGDLLTTTIWECQPSATKDNDGTLDIQHVAMGGLVKRTRVFSSNAALRLAVSTGTIDSSTGAYVTLSFSDDQGKTWTTLPSINLTQGDFEGEIAWRGLGSFAAPGRLYRIIDVGGFVRIDGCDAEMDNFDEDESGGRG